MNTYKKVAQSIVGDMPYPGNPLLLSDAKNAPKKKIKRLRDEYELMNPGSVIKNRVSSSFDIEAQIEEGDNKKLKSSGFSSIDTKSADEINPAAKKRSPSTYNEYIRDANTPDVGEIGSDWGIYDDNFMGGRKRKNKTKRRYVKKARSTKRRRGKKSTKKRIQKRCRGATRKRLRIHGKKHVKLDK